MRTVWVPVLPYMPKADAKIQWTQWLKDHALGEGDFRDSEVTWNTSRSANPNAPVERQYLVKRRALLRLNLPAGPYSYVPRTEPAIRRDDE